MSNIGVVGLLTPKESCTAGTAKSNCAEVIGDVDSLVDDPLFDNGHMMERVQLDILQCKFTKSVADLTNTYSSAATYLIVSQNKHNIWLPLDGVFDLFGYPIAEYRTKLGGNSFPVRVGDICDGSKGHNRFQEDASS